MEKLTKKAISMKREPAPAAVLDKSFHQFLAGDFCCKFWRERFQSCIIVVRAVCIISYGTRNALETPTDQWVDDESQNRLKRKAQNEKAD